MKTFACKSMGLDCDFETEGALEDEVMADALAHIEEEHPEEVEVVEESEEDLPETVRTYIEDDEL